MNLAQQAYRHYSQNSSSSQIGLVLAGVGAAAALLTFLFVYFVGQNSDHLVLRYLMSVLFFAGGVFFFIIARNAEDDIVKPLLAIIAFSLFFSMIISLIVTIVLFAFFV
jgi:hypothetical protein